ncbi:TPA: hypothetical protein ACFRHF_001756 [Neisseria lactamica]|uniref:Lipoprotein n=1 Tax=Neisseria lactamica (strain 020-06) TaxID=489653 RepID=E4Z9X4_NEIL0|nr:hypothetical protein [Neisseria lactamica]CBN86319.1 hypothetical protein NLA_0750 [Neisseria lactamica 020-06]
MFKQISCLAAASLLLTGCMGSKIDCSNEAGLSALQNIIIEAVEMQMRSNNGDLTLSSVRASIAKIGMAVESIRTSKNDPNSNKVFCEGKLTLSLPSDLIEDARASLKAGGKNDNIEQFLSGFNYQKSAAAANKYQIDLIYNLQPTDDGKQVYAEPEDSTNAVSGISKLLDYALSKNKIINQKLEEKRIEEEEARQAELMRKEEKERQAEVKRQQTIIEDEMRPTDEMESTVW